VISSAAIAAEIAAIDPALPPPAVVTLEHEMGVALIPQRVAALVTGTLGALGLLLAAAGLYGLVGYSVNLRLREIGVRMALGAHGPAIVRLVLGGGVRLIASGAAIGLGASFLVSRLLDAYLLSVSPFDPVALGGAVALLAVVTVAASYVPARRAASADPLVVLRSE
jgi:ABC-type antimicrobial peptide transport system permease subunit